MNERLQKFYCSIEPLYNVASLFAFDGCNWLGLIHCYTTVASAWERERQTLKGLSFHRPTDKTDDD